VFAPKVAKPQTKATEGSTSRLVLHRSTLVGQRVGYDPVEQALFLQRSIGNQATLRLLPRRDSRGASRGASWDFSKIPLFPPERASEAQPPFPPAATPIRSAIQAKLVVGQPDEPRLINGAEQE
jgi:hypothetical protein